MCATHHTRRHTGQRPDILSYLSIFYAKWPARLSRDKAECHALVLRNIWREIKGARVVTQVYGNCFPTKLEPTTEKLSFVDTVPCI